MTADCDSALRNSSATTDEPTGEQHLLPSRSPPITLLLLSTIGVTCVAFMTRWLDDHFRQTSILLQLFIRSAAGVCVRAGSEQETFAPPMMRWMSIIIDEGGENSRDAVRHATIRATCRPPPVVVPGDERVELTLHLNQSYSLPPTPTASFIRSRPSVSKNRMGSLAAVVRYPIITDKPLSQIIGEFD